MMNQDREDVSMVEGELPVQPTNASMITSHLLPEAAGAAAQNITNMPKIESDACAIDDKK